MYERGKRKTKQNLKACGQKCVTVIMFSCDREGHTKNKNRGRYWGESLNKFDFLKI